MRVAAKPTIDPFGPTPEQRHKRFEHVPHALSDMATLQLPTCYIRKYDSCWEQEGETQSDGDEELELLYSRQKVAKTTASTQQHVDEKVRSDYAAVSLSVAWLTDWQPQSSISELPTEILMQILHFLPPLDIIKRYTHGEFASKLCNRAPADRQVFCAVYKQCHVHGRASAATKASGI